MKEQILKLRAEGKTYRQIVKLLGCSKGTVAYHCGDGQKSKELSRQSVRRKDNPFLQRADRLRNCVRHFKRDETGIGHVGNITVKYTAKDVKAKFEKSPYCYLSGRKLDVTDPKNFELDHIVARSKGGTNDLSNLGLTCRAANIAKSDLSVEELFVLCKDILTHNGYRVEKI